MANRPTLMQRAAVTMLLSALQAGADPVSVRPHFATVKKSTWYRWVREAKRQYATINKHGAPQTAAKEEEPAGELIVPDVADQTDVETYAFMAHRGPQETTVVSHFVDPQNINAHDALELVERLGQQFIHADALMKSTLKRVKGGHAIIDKQAFAAAVKLQIDGAKALHALLKDAHSLQSVQRLLDTVVTLLQQEDKEFGRRVVALLRKAARQFNAP